MSGEWLIRQPSIDGRHTTERVTIEDIPIDTASGTALGSDPVLVDAPMCMTFHYADGRILTFPYANILRAEYRPHTEP